MKMGHWEDINGEWYFTEDELIKDLLDPIVEEAHERFDDYIDAKYNASTFLHMLFDGEAIDPQPYFDEVEKEIEKEVRMEIIEGEDLELLGWRYIWVEDDDDPNPLVMCPGCHAYCDNEQLLGNLGSMATYRCHRCGMTFHRENTASMDVKPRKKASKKGKRKPLIKIKRK